MAHTVMRNRVTTEYRQVERDSQEFYALRSEMHADGRPRWEQTGEHDLRAYEQRQAAGAPAETDRGDGDPVPILGLQTEDVFMPPQRGYPTAGEIEQGAGKAGEEYCADDDTGALLAQRSIGGVVEGTATVGDPGIAPETTSMEDLSTGDSVVADGGGGSPKASGPEYSSKGYDDLKAEVTARDIEVTGSGNGGRVLKSDMVSALVADDADSHVPPVE